MSSSKIPNTRTSCGNCRQRKVRCDALKPTCTPCRNRNKGPVPLDGDPCEYPGESGLTRAEMLEIDVSRLEKRVRELERAEDPLSVRLQRPYSTAAGPSGPPGSTPSMEEGRIFNDFLTNFNQEPHINIRLFTLSWFLSNHSTSFGIFLNQSRLLEGFCSPLPFGHPSRPSTGLILTLYLVASRVISPSPSLPQELGNVQQDASLTLVLNHISNALSSTHPKRIIHTVQAEVILANLFFHIRRNLEGRYHLNTALSLAAGAGLHRLQPLHLLPPPMDQIERGEMINAFWTVYSSHNVWSAVEPSETGDPSILLDRDGQKIDVPWPMDMNELEQVCSGRFVTNPGSSNFTSTSTVAHFLSGSAVPEESTGLSLMALHSKASALFARATFLANASRNTNRNNQTDITRLLPCLNHVDNLIDSFGSSLPEPELSSTGTVTSAMILIHTLRYASKIQLHSASNTLASKTKSVEAAKAAVDLISRWQLFATGSRAQLVLNPMFGVLWGIIGRVLIANFDGVVVGRRTETSASLGKLIRTMEVFSEWSPLVAYEARRLREL